MHRDALPKVTEMEKQTAYSFIVFLLVIVLNIFFLTERKRRDMQWEGEREILAATAVSTCPSAEFVREFFMNSKRESPSLSFQFREKKRSSDQLQSAGSLILSGIIRGLSIRFFYPLTWAGAVGGRVAAAS